MTLLFVDGFDVGDFALKWTDFPVGVLPPATDSASPFGAGLSLKFPADVVNAGQPFSYLKRAIPAASATAIVGFNFKYTANTSVLAAHADMALLTLYSAAGATTDLVLKLRDDGTLDLYNGSGSLLGSGPASAMLPGIWYFVEVKASASTIEVRVNEASKISVSGLSVGSFDALALNRTPSATAAQSSAATYIDDLYVCNALGSANNDYLGMGRVQTLLPSAAGTDTHLTPVGSASNWDNVNDVPYSTADYNYSPTPGTRDTYALDNLASATANVKGIQTVLIGEADDATAHVKAALRSGGTVYYDATVALDGSPSDASIVVRETDPATSAAWTVSGVNALEAGMEVTT